MLKRSRPALAILLIGLALAACSSCDVAGWLNSCGGTVPKALLSAQ